MGPLGAFSKFRLNVPLKPVEPFCNSVTAQVAPAGVSEPALHVISAISPDPGGQ